MRSVSANRVLVQEDIHDAFVKELTARVRCGVRFVPFIPGDEMCSAAGVHSGAERYSHCRTPPPSSALKVGDGFAEGVDIGPLINEARV